MEIAPEHSVRVGSMTERLHHRGPDGGAVHHTPWFAFGHRRLAIIDRAGGEQPMANEDESVWIVFNGEIYNYLELRRDLEARGHRFRTHSDTEAIVHAYEEYGDACVERLDGMFAFAIGDRTLARAAGARSARQEAVVLRHARRRAPLRVGDQGDQGQPGVERRAGSRGHRGISVARLFRRAANSLSARPQLGARTRARPRRLASIDSQVLGHPALRHEHALASGTAGRSRCAFVGRRVSTLSPACVSSDA